MDTVRFGRVLGSGARHAAKTLLSAADAAAAPNPRPAPQPRPEPTTRSNPAPQVLTPQSQPPRPTAASSPRTRPSAQGLAEGSRRFGRAVWAPTVRLSGVLWLELTGVFFALFALVAAIAAWRLRFALHADSAPSGDHTRLLFAAGMIVVFGYFSVSSFAKARHRSRRP